MTEIEEQLKQYSLAHKVEIDKDVDILTLVNTNLNIQGFMAIKEHLEELSGELHKWYYCDC